MPTSQRCDQCKFDSATVAGANFGFSRLSSAQLYSTAGYEAKDLHGISLTDNNLTGWNFAGQNLTVTSQVGR